MDMFGAKFFETSVTHQAIFFRELAWAIRALPSPMAVQQRFKQVFEELSDEDRRTLDSAFIALLPYRGDNASDTVPE